MSESGRYILTDRVAMGVWSRLTEAFSISSLAATAIISRRATVPFHKNNLGRMLDTQHWKIGLGLLGGLSDAQVAFLLDFAEINARRVEHVFRAWALIMVTVPVGTLVGANELFPDLFGQSLVSFYGALIIIISAWASVAGIMFMSSWRAKDLEDLLRFEMARRTHADAQDTGQDA